jgi:hypothetical protein
MPRVLAEVWVDLRGELHLMRAGQEPYTSWAHVGLLTIRDDGSIGWELDDRIASKGDPRPDLLRVNGLDDDGS